MLRVLLVWTPCTTTPKGRECVVRSSQWQLNYRESTWRQEEEEEEEEEEEGGV